MSRPTVVVVIPCFNTSGACADVIRSAARFADAVLAVDDGSTDDTLEHLEQSGCHVHRLHVNRGKGAALEAGFREVLKGQAGPLGLLPDYVVTLDGDGQHDPREIPALVERARASGAELVVGMRDPRAMPAKSSVGSHYSRLTFMIGTATFLADTQSGFRLLSRALVEDLIDRVTWSGYETESEVLRVAIAHGHEVAPVRISTIYIDNNRRSQFSPWRDSSRIAHVFRHEVAWTVAMAALDFAAFAVVTGAGWLSPAAGNVASRLLAIAAQAALRRDFVARVHRMARQEGGWSCALAFAGHLVITTALVALLTRTGGPPGAARLLTAKAVAQLTGYLVSFAIVDRVMLAREVQRQSRVESRESGVSL